MYGHPIDGVSRFHHRLGKSWMRMDGMRQVESRTLETQGHGGFGHQLRHPWSDHMDAEYLSVLFVAHHLHKALADAQDGSLTVASKGELPDANLVARFARLAFREPYTADLRLTIGAIGDLCVVYGLYRLPRRMRNRKDAFIEPRCASRGRLATISPTA